MAKQKQEKPSALDNMLDQIYGNDSGKEETTDVTNMGMQNSVVEVDDNNKTPDDQEGNSEDVTKKDDFTVGNDDSKIPEHILNNSKDEGDDNSDNDNADADSDDSDNKPSDEEITEAQ